MAEKRKSASIRALEEVHELLKKKCLIAHGRVTNYGSPDKGCNNSPEQIALNDKKHEIIKKISQEIEEYAVKKYPEYGIIIVPLCHRRSSSSEDRLEIDLKVKLFPGAEEEFKNKKAADELYLKDMKAIEDWHFEALKSVALKEELPEVPGLSREVKTTNDEDTE